MTIVAGAGPLSDPAPEPLIPEPRRFEALRLMLFGRPATILAGLVILVFVVVALAAPWLAPFDPLAQSFLKINKPPSETNWLGTDQFGRDVLSRMIWGSRTSLVIGVLAPLLAAVIGTTLQIVGEQLAEAIDLRADERILRVENVEQRAVARRELGAIGREHLRADFDLLL